MKLWGMKNSQTQAEQTSFRVRCAHYLRTERERQRVSQEELAVRAGFHRTYVSYIERAVQNMSLENVEKLLIALGIQLCDEEPNARARLAANLRRIRTDHGLSQEKLAEMAGLHRTYVSQVERGVVSISLDNIERLAQALGIVEDDLVGIQISADTP